MIAIDVPDMNDSSGRIALSGKNYWIRFTYNSIEEYWSFSLFDVDKNPMLGMIKIVPNVMLNAYYTDVNLPDGWFVQIGTEEPPKRTDFKNGLAKFYFVPKKEVEEYAELGQEL